MEHPRLISEFISKTGADNSIAKKVLEEHQWKVDSAVKSYKIVHTAALPPVGPRKNMEINQSIGNQPTEGGGPGFNGKNTSPTSTLEYRKLKRGLSKTTENVQLVCKARESVLQDISETVQEKNTQHFVETPEYTFILPDLTKFPEDFRAFLHKDLIETSTLVSLEQAGRLNWWADLGACNRLLPLATTGDGNCLLHAASLGMWGFHDRQLTLRRALYTALSSGVVKGSFWRRWRWQQTLMNKESGLILSETEWQSEWNSMLKLASTTPRTQPGSHASCCDSPATKGLMERPDKEASEDTEVFYESLEEFHVFVLAHVLRRPIIVVADTVLKNCDGEALAPIPFGGVYLPLECQPSECHRSPLLLTYDAAHFSALVPMEESSDGKNITGINHTAAMPVVDPELNLLPIHFLVEPGSQFVWNKDEKDLQKVKELDLTLEEKLNRVQEYLDLMKVPISTGTSTDGGSDSSEGSRPRSNSWSCPKAPLYRSLSVDSTESNHSGSNSNSNTLGRNSNSTIGSNNNIGSNNALKNTAKDKDKDKGKDKDKKKEKDKFKSGKQMQNVVKSFGSLGKTMSKKLKNLGGIKAVSKGEEEERKNPGKKVRKPSIGSVTQSTKTSSSLTAELLKDRDHVLCARLLHKRLEYQDKMVSNYLQAARQNFEQDRVLRKKQDAEMKTIAEKKRLEQETPVNCINPGCEGIGTPATSYLCPQCYDKQRKEALDLEKGPNIDGCNDQSVTDGPRSLSNSQVYDTKPVVMRTNPNKESRVNVLSQHTGGDLQRQNTIVNLGSSKFYTYADEEQSLPPPKYCDHTSNNFLKNADSSLNNFNAAPFSKVDKAPLELSRSSFYDVPLTTQVRPKDISKAPGTAVIINNLHDKGYDNSDGHHQVSRPLNYDLNRQNAAKSWHTQAPIPSHCGPKVSNTSVQSNRQTDNRLQRQSHAPATPQPQPQPHPQPQSVGQYVSRIQIGESAAVETKHKCKNVKCSNNGYEKTDFYCAQCYQVYDRDRTTFL